MSIFGGIGSVVGADIIAYVKLSGADTFNKDLDKLNTSTKSLGNMMNATLNAALVAGAAAFVASSAAAITFESSFAGVLKTTEGLTDEFGAINAEGVKLSEEFRKLALVIPVSVNELNRIGELGGQLGIAKGDLVKFTEVIAKLGATTDLSYEQGATAIAQFINVTKNVVPSGLSVQQQIERIASALVDLGNKSVATESGIMEFAQRLAGAGATVGLTQDQILSFSAAFASVGLNAEMGATAFSKLMIEMKSAVETGSKDLAIFSKVAGVDFKQAFQEDAANAIKLFIEGLNNTSKSGGSVIQVLGELGIKETRMRTALLLAANAGDLLNDTLGVGAKAYKDNTALTDEFAKKVQTTKAQLILLKNAVYDVFIDLGQNFLPAIRSVAQAFAAHPGIIKAVVATLIGGAGLIAAFKALIAINNTFKALKAIEMFSGLSSAIGGSAMALTGSIALYAALAGAILLTINAIGQYKDAQETLAKANKLVDDTNIKIEQGLGSMNSALYTLGQHARTDMVLMNGKLWEVGDAIDLINKLIDQGKVAEVSLQFGEAAITSGKAKAELDKYVESLVELDKAGITTTEQVKDSIAKFEKLRDVFGDDKVAGEELTAKIEELKDKLFYANLDAGKYAVTFESVADALGNHGIATRDVKDAIEELTSPLEELDTTTIEYVDTLGKWNDQYGELGDLIRTVTDDMGATGEAISFVSDSLVTAITTGLNPFTFAMQFAAFAFQTLTADTDELDFTLEDFLTTIYGTSSAVLDLKDNFESLNDEFGQYDLIDNLKLKVKELEIELVLLTAYGQENTQAWIDVRNELGLTAEQVEILTNSFTFLDQVLSEQSAYLTENVSAAWEYYGGAIPDEKMQAWLALLAENTAKLQLESGALAVGSQAWLDNETAINANNYIMGLLNNSWDDYAGYLATANLSMEQASRFLFQMGLEGEALDNALLELGFTTYNSGVAIDGLSTATTDVSTEMNTLAQVTKDVDESMEALAGTNMFADDAYNQFLYTLSYVNDEMERQWIIQQELASQNILTDEQINQQIIYWQTLLSAVSPTSYAFQQISGILDGLYDKLGQTGPWEDLAGLIRQTEADIRNNGTAVNGLIDKWGAYLATIGPSNPAFATAQAAMYDLIRQYQALGVPINFVIDGRINIPPLTDAQLRTLYAGYVVHMKEIGQGYYNYSYWLGKFNSGEILLHSGGMIEGLASGSYGSMKEVPFTGLEGEYVLNPNIGRRFGEAALNAFNVSANPAVLGGEGSSMPNIEVIVEPTIEITGELSEMAWARIVDTKINKRIKEIDTYKVKGRI